MAEVETPVLDALAEITAVSIDRCNLDDLEAETGAETKD